MHTDEAVNAYIVGQLLAGETFTYDPQDRHGPALAALALPLARLQGAKTFSDLTESELRLTTVLAGTVTILLFGAAVEMFGFVPCLIAALLFAAAPLPVYYDRYFIHESLFVAATFGLILSGWRACTRRSAKLAVSGCCMRRTDAGLQGDCGTALLRAGGCGARLLALESAREEPPQSVAAQDCAGCGCRFSAAERGSIHLVRHELERTGRAGCMRSPTPCARAGGEGHAKALLVLRAASHRRLVGRIDLRPGLHRASSAVRKRDASPMAFWRSMRLFIAVIYSLIPYKTPWLALNFWLPIALFAGLAIESLWRMPAKYPALRIAAAGLLHPCAELLAAVLIAHDTRQRVFLHPAEETNPYAYAHTSEDLLGLPAEIADLAHQEGTRIAAHRGDCRPIHGRCRGTCGTFPKSDSGSQASKLGKRGFLHHLH